MFSALICDAVRFGGNSLNFLRLSFFLLYAGTKSNPYSKANFAVLFKYFTGLPVNYKAFPMWLVRT